MTETENSIGGKDFTVEIDECMVSKRKYNKGRILSGQVWIFGGVTRGTNECFIEFVENRSRETLLDVIGRRIKPGSIIASDQWIVYKNLNELLPEMEFKHISLNHSKNFVNPDDLNAHTQNIEAFWSLHKRKLRLRGGTNYRNNIEYYFGEHLYRNLHKFDLFEVMIDRIANYFG